MKKTFLILISIIRFFSYSNAQWSVQQSGTRSALKSVYFTDANTGFIVGSNDTILKTTNGGKNWIPQAISIVNRISSIYFTNSTTGYVVGENGLILKTTDGGNIWTAQNSGTLNNLNSVFFPTNDTGYVIGKWGTILKTTNGGNLWTVIYGDSSLYFTGIYFVNVNIGYITSHLRVLKTTDGGNSWVILPYTGSSEELSSLFFINKDTGFVTSQFYPGIYKTIDGGNTWSKQTVNIVGFSSIYFVNDSSGFAVGGMYGEPFYTTGNTIVKTTDGGNTWISEKSPTSNSLNCVYFPNASVGYACGEKGTIIKMSNSTDTIPVNDTTYATIIDKRSINILPNPAKTTISITTNNKQLFQNATVSITTINGKQVLQQTLKNDKTSIDVSTLSAGLYFAKVWNGSLCWVGRFLKE